MRECREYLTKCTDISHKKRGKTRLSQSSILQYKLLFKFSNVYEPRTHEVFKVLRFYEHSTMTLTTSGEVAIVVSAEGKSDNLIVVLIKSSPFILPEDNKYNASS